MKRYVAVPVALAIVAAVLAFVVAPGSGATATKSSRAGASIPSLRVGIPITVSSLDFTKGTGGAISALSLEALTTLTSNLQVKPWLASSIVQPNPSTYVYHLRAGVKFWDGSPLTSADVVNSLDYERSATAQNTAFYFVNVKSITAKNASTVVVVLKHPDPSWPISSTYLEIFEKKFQLAHKTTFGQPGTLVMGTGPWQVTSLDPTSGAELTANPHWWGGQPNIQQISYKFFSDENSEALAFRAGDIDIVGYPINDLRGFARTANAPLLTSSGCNSFFFFTMNTQVAPWNDVHVRRAVAYAINRPGLINANGGYATPVTQFIDPAVVAANAPKSKAKALLNSLPKYPYSLAKAKQELAKSAYPHGFSTTLIETTWGNINIVGQALAGQLAKIGIKAKVKVISNAAYSNSLQGPAAKRPASFWWGGCSSPTLAGMDPYLGSANTAVGGLNIANYTPKAVDKLIAAGESAALPAQRFSIYSKLFKTIATDVPYVPVYLADYGLAISSKFSFPDFNSFYGYYGPWLLHIKAKG